MSQILAESTLADDAASISLDSLDFTGILAAQLLITGQAVAGAWDRCILRFNDDAARNYLWGVQNNDDTRADNTDTGTYVAGLEVAHISGPDLGVDYWGRNSVDIFLPGSSDVYKHTLVRGGMGISNKALSTTGCGIWRSTSPISKITMVPNAGGVNLKAGTKLSLVKIAEGEALAWVPPAAADLFDRADGPLGSNWTTYGLAPGSSSVVGNQLHFSHQDAPDNGAWWNATPLNPDQFSQFKVRTQPASSEWYGVTARCDSGGANCYSLIYFNNAGTKCLWLFVKNAGVYTALGAALNTTLTLGDTIRIETQGTTIRALVNDATVITRTDATVAGGNAGVCHYAANCSADDWSAGNL